jgi:hypothetical protein
MDWLIVLSAAMIGMGAGAVLAFWLFCNSVEERDR